VQQTLTRIVTRELCEAETERPLALCRVRRLRELFDMLLRFIGLWPLPGGLERRIWADAVKQRSHFRGESLPDEMPVHFAQPVVGHPSSLALKNIHGLVTACPPHRFPGGRPGNPCFQSRTTNAW